jgi:hypothetical protein
MALGILVNYFFMMPWALLLNIDDNAALFLFTRICASCSPFLPFEFLPACFSRGENLPFSYMYWRRRSCSSISPRRVLDPVPAGGLGGRVQPRDAACYRAGVRRLQMNGG